MHKQILKNQSRVHINGIKHLPKKQSGKILKKNNKNIKFSQNQQIKSEKYIPHQLQNEQNCKSSQKGRQIHVKQKKITKIEKIQQNPIHKIQQSLQNILEKSKLKKVKSQDNFPKKYRNLIESYEKQHQISKKQIKSKQDLLKSRITNDSKNFLSQPKLKPATIQSSKYVNYLHQHQKFMKPKIKQPYIQTEQDMILRQRLKQIQLKYLQLQKSYKNMLIQTKNEVNKYENQKIKLSKLKKQHFQDQNQLDKLRQQYFNKNKQNLTSQTSDLNNNSKDFLNNNSKDYLDNINTKSISIQVSFDEIIKQQTKNKPKSYQKQITQQKIIQKQDIQQQKYQQPQFNVEKSQQIQNYETSQQNQEEVILQNQQEPIKSSLKKVKQQKNQKHQSQMNWFEYIKKQAGRQFIEKNYLQKIQTKSNFSGKKQKQKSYKYENKIKSIQKQIIQSLISSNKKPFKNDQQNLSYFKPKSYYKDLNGSQLRKSRKKSQDDISQLKKDLFNAKKSKEYLQKSSIKLQNQQLKKKQYETPKLLSPSYSKYRFKPSINIQ